MNGGAIIEQLLLVEWSDTCEEVFLRVGEKMMFMKKLSSMHMNVESIQLK